MSIISFKDKKEDIKLIELSYNLEPEYVLNKAKIKSLGLSEFYPSEVFKMLLKASAFKYFTLTRYPISFSRFLTLFEDNLTTNSIGNIKCWYYDHEVFAKTSCDNELVNHLELFSG
jgi:hypothetical protein